MDNLQKLLDERWPLNQDLSNTDLGTLEMFRQHFTEGYNARIAEEKELPTLEPILLDGLIASIDTLERLKKEFKTEKDGN